MNDLFQIVESFLLSNSVSFDKNELALQIQSHPSYPSLHAITGVLDHFGVENFALNLPKNEEVYPLLPDSFIAHMKSGESENLVFAKKNKTTIAISLPNNQKKNLSKSTFLKEWTGVIVAIEKKKTKTKKSKQPAFFLKTIPMIFLIGLLGFSILRNIPFNISSISIFTLSLIGIYVSYLLVQYDLGVNSTTVDKLCSSSEKTSCQAIINSKGASIFGLFKLSDASFIFFSSTSITWFVHLATNSTEYTLLLLLSLSTTPIVFYSIYYQAIVVKKWCPLCLTAAGILTCQSLLALSLNPLPSSLGFKGFMILAISTFISIVSYMFIKPLVSSKLRLSKKEVEFYKFKRNFSLFNTLHRQKTYLNTAISEIKEITFGNKNAKIELVIITNPLCGFCKVTHRAIDGLLKTQQDTLKVTIRFNIEVNNKEGNSYQIASALINLYQQDKITCREAMRQIFSNNVSVTSWLDTYKVYVDHLAHPILEKERQWCLTNNINFTPAIYLNNQEYPNEYELNDLSFFIDNIIEQKKQQGNIKELVNS